MNLKQACIATAAITTLTIGPAAGLTIAAAGTSPATAAPTHTVYRTRTIIKTVVVPGPTQTVQVPAFGTPAIPPTTGPVTAAEQAQENQVELALNDFCGAAGLVPYVDFYQPLQMFSGGCVQQGQTFPGPPKGWS